MTTMLASDLPLPRIGRGKVRDIYAVGDDRVLLLTTDRISAFDVVMAETIPMKGAVLTQISAWWFDQLEGVVPHHMISADADAIISEVPALQDHRAALAGRAMLCRRTTVFPIECVIRGYISGSAWKEYAAQGTLAGEKLHRPARKRQAGPSARRPRPRPAMTRTSRWRMRETSATRCRHAESMTAPSIRSARDQPRPGHHHRRHQIRFGRDGRIILIDEVMTPDSSRFWAADVYAGRRSEFRQAALRDYSTSSAARRWNGDAPPPPLPAWSTPPASAISKPIAASPADLKSRPCSMARRREDATSAKSHHRRFPQPPSWQLDDRTVLLPRRDRCAAMR